MKSPQQQFYDKLYMISMELGYDTYDFLPERDVSYPFVFIGEYYGEDIPNKSTVTGEFTKFIRVYNANGERRETTDMVDKLIREIRKIKHTDTFYIKINRIRHRVEIESVTTGQPLVGRIEIDYQFN